MNLSLLSGAMEYYLIANINMYQYILFNKSQNFDSADTKRFTVITHYWDQDIEREVILEIELRVLLLWCWGHYLLSLLVEKVNQ